MPWGVAAAAVGAGISSLSANSAANKQQKAGDAALQEQQRQYDTTRNDNAPALQARNSGLASMQGLAGSYQASPTADQVMAQPGYKFGMDQGLDALNSNAAATGGLYSGAALKAAATYGTNYGSTKYQQAFDNLQTGQNNQFNRYASLAGAGQVGANAINSAGQNMANQNTNTLTGLGNAQGAASIAQGNAWGKMGSQLGNADWGKVGSTVGGWFGGGGVTSDPYGMGVNPYGYDLPTRGGMADGGPIQRDANGVPILGSKSPVRTGGGGGLSVNALAALLQQQPQPQQQQPALVPVLGNPLGGNPLTDPAAILAARMKAAGAFANGGPITGPGGPRDDLIPIMASNGEHMFDEPSVTAIGGGDNAKGQAKLNKLRLILQGAK